LNLGPSDYEIGDRVVVPLAASFICGKNRPICGQHQQVGKKTLKGVSFAVKVLADRLGFFILKPLLDEVIEELVMCPQMKFSIPVFQHVTANETVLAMPANEKYPETATFGNHPVIGHKSHGDSLLSILSMLSSLLMVFSVMHILLCCPIKHCGC
jgi:hypothetical protein